MILPSTIEANNIVKSPPQADHNSLPIWFSEQIWGHRLYSQSPWLIFLEFLTVASSCYRDGNLLDEKGNYYPLNFKPNRRMFLRNILWNNESIKNIAEQNQNSNEAWSIWEDEMSTKALGADPRNFEYLKPRFRSFHDFAALVLMLQRDASVESETNKRWTSRFVFPFGPNALYEDLGVTKTGIERQYINFGRTGELLYLMLCRSASVDLVRPHLHAFLDGNNGWNRLLGRLQPNIEEELISKGKSYLPYINHPSFDNLGQDWLKIFELNLPKFDAVWHLVTLGAMHLMLYQLRVAREWTKDSVPAHFICEVVAPKKTFVRQQSIFNFQNNNGLATKAIEAYVDEIQNSDEWQKALTDSTTTEEAYVKCRMLLEKQLWWKAKEYHGEHEPDKLLQKLREVALDRHRKQAISDIHRIYGREIGLVSRRGTNRYRYAPSDALLKTLLLANVAKRMELKEFLQILYERYGLIFGSAEAEKVLQGADFEPKHFDANQTRLEQRLGSLGLLRRLSDGCAYVINPNSKD